MSQSSNAGEIQPAYVQTDNATTAPSDTRLPASMSNRRSTMSAKAPAGIGQKEHRQALGSLY